MYKLFAGLFLSILFISVPAVSHAAFTINSITVNGGASTQVQPGDNIVVTVSATLTNGTKWKGTNWGISQGQTTSTCVNSKNAKEGTRNTSDGVYTETFIIKAPADPGLYNANFQADGGNNCGQPLGTVYSAPAAIRVGTNTVPPVIESHDDILVYASGPTVVTYTTPLAADDEDGPVAVACSPASGSVFPLGDTYVSCTAQDSQGNMAAPSIFKVTVAIEVPPTPIVLAGQSDESYLCDFGSHSNGWQDCFTHSGGIETNDFIVGANGYLGDIKIALASPLPTNPADYWGITVSCFTDSAHTTACPEFSSLTQSASDNIDGTHFVAHFGGTQLLTTDRYYRISINDAGWSTGAYGSQSLSQLFWQLTGLAQ